MAVRFRQVDTDEPDRLLDTPSKGSYLLNDKEVAAMNDDELAQIRNEEIGSFSRRSTCTASHRVAQRRACR